jgi:hypothetical protein
MKKTTLTSRRTIAIQTVMRGTFPWPPRSTQPSAASE